jgi:hypothetical protein
VLALGKALGDELGLALGGASGLSLGEALGVELGMALGDVFGLALGCSWTLTAVPGTHDTSAPSTQLSTVLSHSPTPQVCCRVEVLIDGTIAVIKLYENQ